MMQRSKLFQEIAARTESDYSPDEGMPDGHWRKVIAPKWRNRVGMPRLIAETALFEALGLVRSISRRIFRVGRGSRREAELYEAALQALDELATAFARENWRRFEEGERR